MNLKNQLELNVSIRIFGAILFLLLSVYLLIMNITLLNDTYEEKSVIVIMAIVRKRLGVPELDCTKE